MTDETGPPASTPTSNEGTQTAEKITGDAVAIGQLTANLKDAEATLRKLNKQLEDAPELMKKGAITLQDQTELYKEINRAEAQRISSQQSLLVLSGRVEDINVELSETQLELLKTEEGRKKVIEETLALLSESDLSYRAQLRGINAIETETSNIAKNLGLQRDFQNSTIRAIGIALFKSKDRNRMLEVGLKNLYSYVNLNEIAYKIALKTLSATKKYVQELITANAALNKATGMVDRFGGSIGEAAHTFSLYGLSIGDAGKHLATLMQTMVDFTNESEEARDDLLKTSAEMDALGISTGDFSSSLNYLTKVQGKSTRQSAKFTKKLVEYGVSIGKVPSEFVKEFVSATDKLSIYGGRMEDIFKRLQKMAKGTGVSFDNLISGADKFRDFSEITKMIAGLNAQLGKINLDPMEFLLMDDPAQQLRALRQAIVATGQLERIRSNSSERALLAQTTGFSDADIMKILNNEFDEANKQGADWNEMLDKSSTIMTKLGTVWQTVGGTFARHLAPHLENFDNFLDNLIKNEDNVMSFFYRVTVAVGGLATVFALLAFKAATYTAEMVVANGVTAALGTTAASTTVGVTGLGSSFGLVAIAANLAALPIWAIVLGLSALAMAVVYLYDVLFNDSQILRSQLEWLSDFTGLESLRVAHHGTTDQKGPVKVEENELVLGNPGGGRDIVTERNKENIETLLAKLDKSINNLAGDRKSGDIIIKLDSDVLARAVMSKLKYST